MESSHLSTRSTPGWAVRYVAFLERRAWLVASLLLLVTLLLGLATSRLRLRTDFTDLLPADRPSVLALRRINERLGGVGTLNVAVESSDVEASKRFVNDFVALVRGRLGAQIRSVDYTVAPVRDFYRRTGALFLSRSQLEELDRALVEAIREQRLKANPFYVELEKPPGPSAGERARRLVNDLQQRTRSLDRFPEGYYAGEEGRLLGIFMRTRGSAVEVGAARELLGRAWQLVEELGPRRYHPSLQVHFTGTLQTGVDEYRSIVIDIVSTAGLCVALVSVLVWLYFRLARALVLLGVTLVCGAVWAFGVGSLAWGFVNAQTAFLGSIIVGTGINYGIILLARYQEERRGGAVSGVALRRALAFTVKPTAVAASTTALAFGMLGFAQMTSFAQFGFIGGVGMGACWLLSYTLLPALLVLLERLRPQRSVEEKPDELRIRYPARLARFPRRYALPVAAISGILVAWSAAELSSFLPRSLESDMNRMRRRGGRFALTTKIDDRLGAIVGKTLVPAVIVANSPRQAEQVCQALERLRARQPQNPVVGRCESIGSFLPPDQEGKLKVIARIRRRLEETPRELLPAEVRQRLDELRRHLPDRPVTVADLPQEIRARFRDRRGDETVVLVAPGEKRTLWKMEDLLAFADAIREIRLPDGTVLRSSGESVIFADLIRTIAHDAPRTTALAGAGVLLVLAVTLRRARPVAAVAAALVTGVVLMAGLAAFLRVKYNFFNFVALPTTFGIGVDYPVNVQQRHDQDGRRDIERTLAETGSAVLVASLTTIIGYGVLLISDSLALASFGSLAILGEATCLAAALLLLPALNILADTPRPGRVVAPVPSGPLPGRPS